MIISVAGQKGGTGKSTLTICMAVELQRRANPVLIIDADLQGTATTWRDTAMELGHQPPDLLRVANGRKLAELVQGLEGFEYVLIDLPSDLKDVTRAALVVSDVVLCPCGASATEMWSLTGTVDTIVAARKQNPNLQAYVVQTRVQWNTRAGRSLREDLAPWGLTVLYQVLSQRVSYRDAIAAGLGVTTYPADPKAGGELHAFVDELLSNLKGGADESFDP